MRFYKTKEKIKVPAGVVLELTKDQVRRRKHLLIVDDGVIATRSPVEFKAGEIVGFEQEPRALLQRLEPVEFDDLGDGEMFGTNAGEDNATNTATDSVNLLDEPDAGGESVGDDQADKDAGAADAATDSVNLPDEPDAGGESVGDDQADKDAGAAESTKPARRSAK